jgi:hypothetical protein
VESLLAAWQEFQAGSRREALVREGLELADFHR